MLFCNIDLLDENFALKRGQYVGVKDGKIAYIGDAEPQEDYGERYDGKHRLLMSGFYNVHSHAPMTLLRGYAENLPLQRWLGEKVFPFEDKIDDEAAYYGTQLSIAEMLASGTVSFSDMYFFFDGMMPAIRESGIKCNLSRGLTVFDDSDYESLAAYKDNLRLLNEWNGEMGGRLIGDLCIHGEYTSTPKVVEAIAAHAKDAGARIHIHLSETQTEHEECKQRHGLTPAAYMEAHGIFDSPTTAAHCVWLEPEDMRLLAKRKQSQAGIRLREYSENAGEGHQYRARHGRRSLQQQPEYSAGYLPVRRGLQGFLSRFHAADACAGAAHRNARRCALAGTHGLRQAGGWI